MLMSIYYPVVDMLNHTMYANFLFFYISHLQMLTLKKTKIRPWNIRSICFYVSLQKLMAHHLFVCLPFLYRMFEMLHQEGFICAYVTDGRQLIL